MFSLNKDIVELILNSDSFSSDAKDLVMGYYDRDLTEKEVNDFLTAFFYYVMDNRRIKQNLFGDMIFNDRANTLNNMLEGLRRSTNNNTLTDSDLAYIKNTLLRNFIIDNGPTMERNRVEEEVVEENENNGGTTDEGVGENTEVYGPQPLIRENIRDMNALREELNRISKELEKGKFDIGVERLRHMYNELNSLSEINNDMQDQVRFNTEVDDNELRDMLIAGNDAGFEMRRLMDRISQMVDIKQTYSNSTNAQISSLEENMKVFQDRLAREQADLAALQGRLERSTDEATTISTRILLDQSNNNISLFEELIDRTNKNIDSLKNELEMINAGGHIAGLDKAVVVDYIENAEEETETEATELREEYNQILRRLEGRSISEIGLEELTEIKKDLEAVHNLSQDLQDRNRNSRKVSIDELRRSLITGEALWNGVREHLIKVNSEVEIKTNLLDSTNTEIDETNEFIKHQEELIKDLNERIKKLQELIEKTDDPVVLEQYNRTLEDLKKQLEALEADLERYKALLEELNRKLDLINKGGVVDSRTESEEEEKREESSETRTTDIDPSLSPREQLDKLRSRYDEIMARLNGRELDEIGIIELRKIKSDFEQLHKGALTFSESIRFNRDIDTVLAMELLNESDRLYEDIRLGMIPPTEKLKEKVALAWELIERKRTIESNIKGLESLIEQRQKELDRLRKELESITDPTVKANYEKMIADMEEEINLYKEAIKAYNEELENIDRLMELLRNGGPYKDLLEENKDKKKTKRKRKSSKKKSTKEEETKEEEKDKEKDKKKEKDEDKDKDSSKLVPPNPKSRPKPSGLPTNVFNQPRVKYNSPKLTWKTAVAVAAGIGIGATVFFVAGPTGVAVMSIVNSVALKVVSGARAKAAANRMNILGGEVEVESVEEPKKGIKGAIERFGKYIKSEEGLRDISWMLTSAIITGNALSVGSAIRSKIIANKAAATQVPTEAPATEMPANVETVEAVPDAPAVTAEPTPAPTPVGQLTETPITNSVYDGIRIGNNVGDYNVTIGHRQATKAFGGWDPLHLNQKLVTSSSTFDEFAIVDDTGKLIKRITTPGLSLDEVCAQYGVNYSNIVTGVYKNGSPQAWISVSELVKGLFTGAPTL